MSAEFKIGRWLVSPAESILTLGDATRPIEPKAMELLVILAEAKGELVTRADLMELLWDGRYVTDYALNNLVASLRKHLAADQETDEYIKTRPKKGYQLCVSVERLSKTNSTSSEHVKRRGDRRQKKKLPWFFWFSGIGVFSLLLVLGTYWLSSQNLTQEPRADQSIAVLPFDVFDDEEEIGFFADGLAEEIIHQLTVLPELSVVSRTSSFSFRGKQQAITEIARQLQVGYLLEGSIRREGSVFRITLQLIKGADGSHVWSKVFSAENDEVFMLQELISNDVARSIDTDFVALSPSQVRIHPNSGQAYMHLLKGRGLNAKATAESYQLALTEFGMATQLEPDYAIAYVDTAINYLLLYQHRKLPLELASQKAQEAIDTALRLQPELAEAQAAMGLLHVYNQRPQEAEKWFKSALEINPDMYVAQINYGYLFFSQYRKAEALPHYLKALEVHPLSAVANWGVGNIYIGLGRFDDAWRQYIRCTGLLPDYMPCAMGLAYVQRLMGQDEKAQQSIAKVMEKASPTDYYAQMANGFHLLWAQQYELSEELLNGMFKQYQYDLEAIQTLTLAKLHNDKIAQWRSVLEEGMKRYPENFYISMSAALAAYYESDCQSALAIYTRVLKKHPYLHSDFDQMANGMSNAANMATCYLILEDVENAQQMIAKLKQDLADYSLQEKYVPGIALIKAKLSMLEGKEAESIALISELKKKNWPMLWLINNDPLFIDKTGLTIGN